MKRPTALFGTGILLWISSIIWELLAAPPNAFVLLVMFVGILCCAIAVAMDQSVR